MAGKILIAVVSGLLIAMGLIITAFAFRNYRGGELFDRLMLASFVLMTGLALGSTLL